MAMKHFKIDFRNFKSTNIEIEIAALKLLFE